MVFPYLFIYFIYLFSDFHLEKKKKRALNERLTKPLEVPARPTP